MIKHHSARAWLRVAPLLALVAVGHASHAEENVVTNVIEFETQNRNDDGWVRCGLFKESGWLKDAFRSAIVQVHGKKALCVFKEVPAGVYGISAFHDENSNKKLDTNFVGYPTEEYCASNNARNLMSAPSFSDAKLAYRGGTVRLRGVMK